MGQSRPESFLESAPGSQGNWVPADLDSALTNLRDTHIALSSSTPNDSTKKAPKRYEEDKFEPNRHNSRLSSHTPSGLTPDGCRNDLTCSSFPRRMWRT